MQADEFLLKQEFLAMMLGCLNLNAGQRDEST